MELINKQTAQPEEVAPEEIGNKFLSGQYGFRKSDPVFLADPNGKIGQFVSSDVHEAVTRGGYTFPTGKDITEHQHDEKYGDRPWSSAGLGALDAATFGQGTRVLVGSGAMTQEAGTEIPERNPVSHLVGEVAGVAGSLALVPGSAALKTAQEALGIAKSTGVGIYEAENAVRVAKRALSAGDLINPVSALNKIGSSAAEAAMFAPEAAGTLERLASSALSGAAQAGVEGAGYSLGEINRRAALGDPNITAGSIASQVGLSTILAGTFGAALHGAGSLLSSASDVALPSGAGEATKGFFEYGTKKLLGPLEKIKEGAKFLNRFQESGNELLNKELVEYSTKVLEKITDTVEKSNKKLVNYAMSAVEPLVEATAYGLGKAAPLAGAAVASKESRAESRIKDIEDFNKITTEIALLNNNPHMLLDKIHVATELIHPVAPELSASLQRSMVAATSFLNSKIPQKQTDGIFYEKHIPSLAETMAFKKYYDAVNNPLSIMDALKTNNVSLEGIEAVKTVYPEYYNAMRTQIANQVTQLKSKPNYQKRLALSQFMGQDIDNSLTPQMIMANQVSYQKQSTGQSTKADGMIKPTSKALGNINLSQRYTTPQNKAAQRLESRE